MRVRFPVWMAVLALLLLAATALADQIIMKDGTVYSGKFVRGDANVVEFRILGRIENFKTANIAQIVFKEPELDSSPSGRTAKAPAPPPVPSAPQPEQKPLASDAPPAPSDAALTPAASQPDPPASGTAYPIGSGVRRGEVTLPVGTPVTIRTSTNIDTDRNRVGDVFDATLEQPIALEDQALFARGTTVKGRIAYAKESGKLTGQSQLILELTELVKNGKSYYLRSSDYTEAGANRANRTAATVGGTAALGAIIGAIAGGGTGAAVGAASGAAVGTGVQVLTRGQVLKIPSETILEFRLEAPLVVDTP
jgi:hypothetical protein